MPSDRESSYSSNVSQSLHGESAKQNATVPVVDEEEINVNTRLKDYDMWALGITIVIGGQYFAWNAGLSAGFGSFAIATGLIAIAYGCLILCIAELSSALPFAGGSYGIARVSVGIYPGYLVACFDSIESVIYVATSAVSLGQAISSIALTPTEYEPIYWILFYLSALAIQIYGGDFFWKFNMFAAIISFLILLIYVTGSLNYVSFNENAQLSENDGTEKWFNGGISEFFHILPLPCWFFVGVEAINLACQDVPSPRQNIPRGYITCVATLFCTCFLVLFVACSLPPGITELQEQLTPFNDGFSLMFGLSDRYATLLSLPALYSTAFGFMFSYGRQLRSMGNSRILNEHFGKIWKNRNSPHRALLIGSAIGYSVCIIVYFVPQIGVELFNICMLGAFGAYFAQFISYMVLKTALVSLDRDFFSPLGIFGAILGFLIFFLAAVGIVFYQDNYFAISVFLVYCVVVTVYYHFVVKKRQYFSAEEQRVLFSAHLMKNNFMKRWRQKTQMRRKQNWSDKIKAGFSTIALQDCMFYLLFSCWSTKEDLFRSPKKTLRKIHPTSISVQSPSVSAYRTGSLSSSKSEVESIPSNEQKETNTPISVTEPLEICVMERVLLQPINEMNHSFDEFDL